MPDDRASRIADAIKPLRVEPRTAVHLGRDFDPRYESSFVHKKDGAELLQTGVGLLAEYHDVIGLGTIFSGVVVRRDPTSGLTPPILVAVKWSVIPAALLVLSTELDFLQHGLLTQSLSGLQWLACIGLGLVMPIVVEIDKWIRRRRLRPPAPVPVEVAVAPGRSVATA